MLVFVVLGLLFSRGYFGTATSRLRVGMEYGSAKCSTVPMAGGGSEVGFSNTKSAACGLVEMVAMKPSEKAATWKQRA